MTAEFAYEAFFYASEEMIILFCNNSLCTHSRQTWTQGMTLNLVLKIILMERNHTLRQTHSMHADCSRWNYWQLQLKESYILSI